MTSRSKLFEELENDYYAGNFIKGFNQHFEEIPESLNKEDFNELVSLAKQFSMVKKTSRISRVPRTYKYNEDGEIYIVVKESFFDNPISFRVNDVRFEGLDYKVETEESPEAKKLLLKCNPKISSAAKTIGNSSQREMFHLYTAMFGTNYFTDQDVEERYRGHTGVNADKKYFLFSMYDSLVE